MGGKKLLEWPHISAPIRHKNSGEISKGCEKSVFTKIDVQKYIQVCFSENFQMFII